MVIAIAAAKSKDSNFPAMKSGRPAPAVFLQRRITPMIRLEKLIAGDDLFLSCSAKAEHPVAPNGRRRLLDHPHARMMTIRDDRLVIASDSEAIQR
jgi:hypothetical protein